MKTDSLLEQIQSLVLDSTIIYIAISLGKATSNINQKHEGKVKAYNIKKLRSKIERLLLRLNQSLAFCLHHSSGGVIDAKLSIGQLGMGFYCAET